MLQGAGRHFPDQLLLPFLGLSSPCCPSQTMTYNWKSKENRAKELWVTGDSRHEHSPEAKDRLKEVGVSFLQVL